jgi:hypothetical protein
MASKFPVIPDPTTDPNALRVTSMALKESVEILTQQRGTRSLSAVTWQDLVELGLIPASRAPKTPTSSG